MYGGAPAAGDYGGYLKRTQVSCTTAFPSAPYRSFGEGILNSRRACLYAASGCLYDRRNHLFMCVDGSYAFVHTFATVWLFCTELHRRRTVEHVAQMHTYKMCS